MLSDVSSENEWDFDKVKIKEKIAGLNANIFKSLLLKGEIFANQNLLICKESRWKDFARQKRKSTEFF